MRKRLRGLAVIAIVAVLELVVWQTCVLAQGCGAACLPLDVPGSLPSFDALSFDAYEDDLFDQDPLAGDILLFPPVATGRTQVTITSEFADFQNFREGEDRVANPGGNDAYIVRSAMFVDYRLCDRWALSLLATHVKKDQFTNAFGRRQAIGFGDIAAFARYQIVPPCDHGRGPEFWVGCGFKFPTASLDEPTGAPRLPPAFQVGSGAHDVIPTLNYFQNFDGFSLFGNYFSRLPIERNRNGYRFGQEHEIHFGVRRPLPQRCDRVALLLSLDYAKIDHDSDFAMTLPPRVRDGVLVLNTGGEFLNVTPGVSLRIGRNTIAQARFLLPIYQDWNGERSSDVGQVAPDFLTQITVSFLR